MKLWNIHEVDWTHDFCECLSYCQFLVDKTCDASPKSRGRNVPSRCLGTRQLCTLCSPKVPKSQLTFNYGCTLPCARVNGFGTLFSEHEPWREKHIKIEVLLSSPIQKHESRTKWYVLNDATNWRVCFRDLSPHENARIEWMWIHGYAYPERWAHRTAISGISSSFLSPSSVTLPWPL